MYTFKQLQTLVSTCNATLLSHTPLTGGVSAHTELLTCTHPTHGPLKLIARIHTNSTHKPNATHTKASQEFHLLQTLHTSPLSIPTPKPLHLDLSTLPHPTLLLTFIEGSTRHDLPLPTAIEHMAQTLSTIHSTPLATLQHLNLPTLHSPFPHLWDVHPKTPTLTQLETTLPPPPSTTLLHGDFWPNNILWQHQRITAIIDWEDAATGDPLCDLAGTRLELLWAHNQHTANLFTQLYLSLSQTPLDPLRLALWELYTSSAALLSIKHWGLPKTRQNHMISLARATQQRALHTIQTHPTPKTKPAAS